MGGPRYSRVTNKSQFKPKRPRSRALVKGARSLEEVVIGRLRMLTARSFLRRGRCCLWLRTQFTRFRGSFRRLAASRRCAAVMFLARVWPPMRICIPGLRGEAIAEETGVRIRSRPQDRSAAFQNRCGVILGRR